ncbi:MAG: alanine racemase [Deltaproteobacteria bacterium]|nr:MAG: alanine racemase [Deltaproteobacteria bacterium]
MNHGTLAEINLDNLSYNISAIQQKVSPARVIPVVKADAYGHGAVPVSKRLAREGFTMVAVARLEEAMDLQESGITQSILIFERLFPGEIPTAIKEGFRLTVCGADDIRWIEEAGQEQPALVHVNVDTGMGRMGVMSNQVSQCLDELVNSRHCTWEGLYSHFSTSDEADKDYAHLQLSRFREILDRIKTGGKKPSMAHMANSGAILDIPESYLDAVRPGILMYGHYPSSETSRSIEPRQVMTLKTSVAHVREIPGGYPISYGRRWATKMPTKIAVLPLGYADGIDRRLTNTGEVLIHGRRYPMVGMVTMDYLMVDVGNDPIRPGDEAIIWGESAQGTIQALEVAEKIGTIPYELTCGVSKRVQRVYLGDS